MIEDQSVRSRKVTSANGAGLRAFRDSLKKKSMLRHSVVFPTGQARSPERELLALPWRWIMAGA